MAQDCLVCVIHVIHACALVVGVLSCLSSCVLRLLPRLTVLLPALPDVHLSAQREVHVKPLCYSSLGSVVTSDNVTPLTGYEPKKDLNLTMLKSSTSLPPAMSTSSTPWTTMRSPNDPEVDDNQLAEFLAVVVDRTGKPVEVRSNNDQFSCDIRNLNSALSQFSLVTQSEMICHTGVSVQARSVKALTHRLGQCWMNSEERLSLSAVKKFFITNSSQLKPNKISKFCKKNYCDNNRIFVKFINKILPRWRNYKNSKVLPSMSSPNRSS